MKVYTQAQLANLKPNKIPLKKAVMKNTKQILQPFKKLSKTLGKIQLDTKTSTQSFQTPKKKYPATITESQINMESKQQSTSIKQLVDHDIQTQKNMRYDQMWKNALKSKVKSKKISYVLEAYAAIELIENGFNYDPARHDTALSSQIKIAYFESLCDVSSVRNLSTALLQYSINDVVELLQAKQKVYWMGDHFASLNDEEIAYLGDF